MTAVILLGTFTNRKGGSILLKVNISLAENLIWLSIPMHYAVEYVTERKMLQSRTARDLLKLQDFETAGL